MRKLLLGAALMAAGLGTALAADLRDAWLAARQHHPDMASAAATRATADAKRLQANRLWNPTVSAQATAGAMGAQTSAQGAAFSLPGSPTTAGVGFDTSVRSGPGTRWGIEARLPLYNPERSAQGRQLLASADLAELQAQGAQQQLMLRTAQQYFSAILAQQQYDLLQAQQDAAQKALKEARDRFDLGDAPVTDVREAESRALSLTAQMQSAAVDLQIARQTLAQTTGWTVAQIPSLQLPSTTVNAQALSPSEGAPQALPDWLDLAAHRNLRLRTQGQLLALAEQEAAKASRQASTKIDLVAQGGADHLSGSGRWGDASNSSRQYMVGVQIQVPLYTGGQLDARQQELLRLQEKAQADLDSTRMDVEQQVQAVWLHLQAGAMRTQALQAAAQAAQTRLEATQLGRQVGDRTTLELLQAQNDAMQARSQLLQHYTRMAQERLQLLALVDQLDESALQRATDAEHLLAFTGH